MRFNLFTRLALLFVLHTIHYNGYAQHSEEAALIKVDTLFSAFNKKDAPGYAIGIVSGERMIYKKGFGMANLEYDQAITPATNFFLASVSKQFTAYAILLLAEQGKVQLDDDIRKYLEWFPDLKHTITIRHLLTHTSGIREQLKLLSISGTTSSDYISQYRIKKMLEKQQGLNFTPGEKYSYCNSGYVLLAEIICKVTGQSFRAYMDAALFRPLGMRNTQVFDDAAELKRKFAYSYEKEGTKYSNYIHSNSVYGSSGMLSNVEDMGKWITNFFAPKIGSTNTIKAFTKQGRFNDGAENKYAAGLYVKAYRGQKVFWHSGADAGYRSFVLIFPDLKFGLVVLANDAAADPWNKAYQIADIMLQNKLKPKAPPLVTASVQALLPDNKLTGTYITETGLTLNIWQDKGNLYGNLDGEAKLTRTGRNTYAFGDDPDLKVIVKTVTKDSVFVMANPNVSQYESYRKYTLKESVPVTRLKNYEGSYFCPELDCIYRIVLKNSKLVMKHYRYADAEISFINESEALTGMPAMPHILFTTAHGAISGFDVNSNQIMHLHFNKTGAL